MKRINESYVCFVLSFVVHAGVFGAGALNFPDSLKEHETEIIFEIERPERLPEVYHLAEEKKVERIIKEKKIEESVSDEKTASLLRYQDSIKQKIQEKKRYPRWAMRARHQGVALVVFDVKPGGDIGNLKLRQSSGFKELDQEAQDVVRRAAPFLGFPQGMEVQKITIEVNIVFMLDDQGFR